MTAVSNAIQHLGLAFSIFGIFFISASHGQKMGPHDVLPRGVEQCPDDVNTTGKFVFETMSFKKLSKTEWSFSTVIDLQVPFDDHIGYIADIAINGNGGMKPHFMVIETKRACTDMIAMAPEWMNKTFLASNATGCPIPSGKVEIEDLRFGTTEEGMSGLPAFPYGEYMAQIEIMLDGKERIGCIRCLYSVVPKKKKNKKPKS